MKKPGKFFVVASDSLETIRVAENYLKSMFKENFVHINESFDSDNVYRIRKLKKELSCFDWKTSLLLIESAFSEQINSVILPAILAGRHVVMSGFDAEAFNDLVPSHDMDSLAFFHKINNAVTGPCRPAVYIFLRGTNKTNGYDLFLDEVTRKGEKVIVLDSKNTSQEDFLSLLESVIEKY